MHTTIEIGGVVGYMRMLRRTDVDVDDDLYASGAALYSNRIAKNEPSLSYIVGPYTIPILHLPTFLTITM